MKKTIFLLLVLLGFGCSERAGFFDRPARAYHKILWKYTQEKRSFTLENVQYETSITYKSEEFRRAYVQEYAEMYRLSPEKTEEMLHTELREMEQLDVFVVSHYSTQKDASKITPNARVWRLALSNVSEKDPGVDPLTILSLPDGRDPVITHFYPYINQWSSNYLVKFKKVTPAEKLYVRLTGVLAELIFTWKV